MLVHHVHTSIHTHTKCTLGLSHLGLMFSDVQTIDTYTVALACLHSIHNMSYAQLSPTHMLRYTVSTVMNDLCMEEWQYFSFRI